MTNPISLRNLSLDSLTPRRESSGQMSRNKGHLKKVLFFVDIPPHSPDTSRHHMSTSTLDTQIASLKEANAMIGRLTEWANLSDSALRLRCGELTAQEIRTVRAVLRAIIG